FKISHGFTRITRIDLKRIFERVYPRNPCDPRQFFARLPYPCKSVRIRGKVSFPHLALPTRIRAGLAAHQVRGHSAPPISPRFRHLCSVDCLFSAWQTAPGWHAEPGTRSPRENP